MQRRLGLRATGRLGVSLPTASPGPRSCPMTCVPVTASPRFAYVSLSPRPYRPPPVTWPARSGVTSFASHPLRVCQHLPASASHAPRRTARSLRYPICTPQPQSRVSAPRISFPYAPRPAISLRSLHRLRQRLPAPASHAPRRAARSFRHCYLHQVTPIACVSASPHQHPMHPVTRTAHSGPATSAVLRCVTQSA